MLFGPKSRIHHGKLPERREWCETQENIDDVQIQWTQSGRRDGPAQTDLALSWGQTLLALHAGSDGDRAALPHRVPKI